MSLYQHVFGKGMYGRFAAAGEVRARVFPVRGRDDVITQVPWGPFVSAEWTRDHEHCLNLEDYLPYRLHATPEQLHRAYPQARRFFELKRVYDPGELFQNRLYQVYKHSSREE